MTPLLAAGLLSQPLIMVLLLFSFVFALYAQYKVSSAYKKNMRILSRGHITGREAAEAVMSRAGIDDVEITEIGGHLTDHYDPTHKRLALSSENYRGTSLAALGVSAHEAGHAIQHKVGYMMLKTRMALVPITTISSKLLPLVIIGGFFFRMSGLITLGIVVYAVLTVFHLVTLPVEYDASRRAKKELVGLGIIDRDEMPGVAQTLNAAALTYVAAFLGSLLNMLWLMTMRRN
jgi:uncharacterized protein|uniref:zinc metallopeptidase n=1 Tax=Cephaloticoccus sp. TaxID=1985742 RepID=UPI004049D21B